MCPFKADEISDSWIWGQSFCGALLYPAGAPWTSVDRTDTSSTHQESHWGIKHLRSPAVGLMQAAAMWSDWPGDCHSPHFVFWFLVGHTSPGEIHLVILSSRCLPTLLEWCLLRKWARSLGDLTGHRSDPCGVWSSVAPRGWPCPWQVQRWGPGAPWSGKASWHPTPAEARHVLGHVHHDLVATMGWVWKWQEVWEMVLTEAILLFK